MSGTSLDGIDLAECSFRIGEKNNWEYELGDTRTVPYPDSWVSELGAAVSLAAEDLSELDNRYTRYLGGVISDFLERSRIRDLDAVCSHGHTVLHQPERGVTFQIGNLPELARICGLKVVCDFRVQDVKLGGQGAPLVPIGDRLLFGEYDYCLNLGGFANISSEVDQKRIAYDVCPVNIVMNRYARMLGTDFDQDGQYARSGKVDTDLLGKLDALEYYAHPGPKSLGLEWVRQMIFPVLDASGLSPRDILRTFVAHISRQLISGISNEARVLVSGGGAYNRFLMECLRKGSDVEWDVPDEQLVEFKEALVFGLLGVLRLRGDINCLASVTGARRDHSSGDIFHP